jgi:hypothetical protein
MLAHSGPKMIPAMVAMSASARESVSGGYDRAKKGTGAKARGIMNGCMSRSRFRSTAHHSHKNNLSLRKYEISPIVMMYPPVTANASETLLMSSATMSVGPVVWARRFYESRQ